MDKKENLLIFGRTFKRLRIDRGLTQEVVGFECDISRNWVGEIERGKRNFSYLVLIDMMRALAVSPPDFFKELEIEKQRFQEDLTRRATSN